MKLAGAPLFLLTLLMPVYGQVTLTERQAAIVANKVKFLEAKAKACDEFLLADSIVHVGFQEERANAAKIIALQISTMQEMQGVITKDSLKEIQYKLQIENEKPSWFSKYILRKEVIAVVCAVAGYIIGRQ